MTFASEPIRNLLLLWEGLSSGSDGWGGFPLAVWRGSVGEPTGFSFRVWFDRSLPYFFWLCEPIASLHSQCRDKYLTDPDISQFIRVVRILSWEQLFSVITSRDKNTEGKYKGIDRSLYLQWEEKRG